MMEMWVGHVDVGVVKRTPVRPKSDAAEFHTSVVLNYLQLFCGVRIEIAVRSLPHLGNYMDFQIVRPA